VTALASRAKYPTAKFAGVGSSISGTIVEFEDIPENIFGTNPPVAKTFKDGSTIMQTRVILAQPDESRIALYVAGARMQRAVREAIKESGAKDIEQFGHLTVTRTGQEQGKGTTPAWTYEAKYVSFDPTA
jgi:hypothetical protein